MTADEDQTGKSVENAKPLGYYWRVGPPEASGVGGYYGQLNSNLTSVENGSYLKVREARIGYHVGPILGTGDWTASLVGRNLKTWTRYKGFDPETGSSYGNNGSPVLSANDSYTAPNLRIFTFGLFTRF
jgi:hypothetical protein